MSKLGDILESVQKQFHFGAALGPVFKEIVEELEKLSEYSQILEDFSALKEKISKIEMDVARFVELEKKFSWLIEDAKKPEDKPLFPEPSPIPQPVMEPSPEKVVEIVAAALETPEADLPSTAETPVAAAPAMPDAEPVVVDSPITLPFPVEQGDTNDVQ